MRVEIGPKDVEKNQITCVMRDNGYKFVCPNKHEELNNNINEEFKNQFDRLYLNAYNNLISNIAIA